MLLKPVVFCLVCFANLAQANTTTAHQMPNTASKTYDAKGKLVQRTTSQGRHYNARGQYIGKTTKDGRHYDAQGRYIGKTIVTQSGNRTLDSKGKKVPKSKTR